MELVFDDVNIRDYRDVHLKDALAHVLNIGRTLAQCSKMGSVLMDSWAQTQLVRLDVLFRCLDTTQFHFWVEDGFQADVSHVEHLLECIAEFAQDCLDAGRLGSHPCTRHLGTDGGVARTEAQGEREQIVNEWDWEFEGEDVSLVQRKVPRLETQMVKLEQAIIALALKVHCMRTRWRW
ncbi:hypothetical protein BO94DRAFT_547816 [Aspergillus sclerotioniger CBS 115572]|uniref:Uncharacterized protein n=1 Tax=Aspergillus sclerotioniger CBS 115572 TaxID=1450535 RepID=A0A317W5B5_9EURO|nr:hypothetical protein BO94DRAFT_547816 [Aspergillus sclerotioniger CBS 115572]PWY81533.1 hypothetical protein BO94DRAFT_547816 [Aspergillus sclerotioniger CBS 115572]